MKITPLIAKSHLITMLTVWLDEVENITNKDQWSYEQHFFGLCHCVDQYAEGFPEVRYELAGAMTNILRDAMPKNPDEPDKSACPFNNWNINQYFDEQRAQGIHLNPTRVQWVKDYLAAHDAAEMNGAKTA